MGDPAKDFQLKETYSSYNSGATLDIVSRGCSVCCDESRPGVAYFLWSSREAYFLPFSVICDGIVALCFKFNSPEAAERAAAVYNDNTNYDPEFKEALRLTRLTPTTLELVVPQPNHHICTRSLVTNGFMWYLSQLGVSPKPHPLKSLLDYINDDYKNSGLKETIYLGRLMNLHERQPLLNGSSVKTWEIQEIPIEKCGLWWNPTGKSRYAGGWLIPGTCKFITNLDDPEKSTRPHDCTANGSVMRLSPTLAGLEMTMNGLIRWGLRPQDIAFLRRNGIHGIPMWGCPRRICMTTTHVKTRSISLFGMAAQAVATLLEDKKDVDVSKLPQRVQAAVAGAKATGGWVRYDRSFGKLGDLILPINYNVELVD